MTLEVTEDYYVSRF